MISPRTTRIRTLDGWRGVAILLVIADHANSYTCFRYQLWANLGKLGVDIFFVVSGYIITRRFLEERERSSTINICSFYVRRAFRILPLVGIYLLTLCILSRFVNLVDFHSAEVFGSLFFYRNYQLAAHLRGIYTTHLWSLSIEEHFYLIWPAILVWLGTRRSFWFAVFGATSCAAWRFYDLTHPNSWIQRFLPDGTAAPLVRTDAHCDGLLLGCALAILLARLPIQQFIFRNFPKETPLFMALLLMLNTIRTETWPALSSFVLICVTLASTLVVGEGLAYKWLNSGVLVWIGSISYSVYIWQQLFLLRANETIVPVGRLSLLPYSLFSVLAVSTLSFYCIERPCIALGKRLLAPKLVQPMAVANAR